MIRIAAVTLGVTALAAGVAAVALPGLKPVTYERSESVLAAQDEKEEKIEERKNTNLPEIKHQPLPTPVKAVYMTACVAGTPDFRARLVKLVEETEINSLIIDIKDYSGTISFSPTDERLKGAWSAAKCGARDMRDFIASLHEKGIYVIGRVTVFQDPYYSALHPELAVKRADGVSVWHDFKGLSFIDVGSRDYWDYIIALSRDSYNLGFDEINFDYVRYPSDGPMTDIAFTQSKTYPGDNSKQANLEEFFKYLHEELSKEEKFSDYEHTNTGRASSTPWTSVDLFGMTTTNYDDLSIGQVQDRAAPYFDFVAPMVYPSHYPKNAFGYANPNDYPYEIVYHAMSVGVKRMIASTTPMMGFQHTRLGTSTPSVYQKPVYTADKFRTWIQDFDYGGNYDIAEVKAQIKASVDAGVHSYMIWAPSNIYTRGALENAI